MSFQFTSSDLYISFSCATDQSKLTFRICLERSNLIYQVMIANTSIIFKKKSTHHCSVHMNTVKITVKFISYNILSILLFHYNVYKVESFMSTLLNIN